MERKFSIFALFYFVFEGKFQVHAPQGVYIRREDLTEGFLRYDLGGLIFEGAYTWRVLFSDNPYNPCLEVLTFSNKHNVTGVSVLNLVKMPLSTCSNCHEYARCVDDKCVCLDGYVGNGKVCEGIYES